MHCRFCCSVVYALTCLSLPTIRGRRLMCFLWSERNVVDALMFLATVAFLLKQQTCFLVEDM